MIERGNTGRRFVSEKDKELLAFQEDQHYENRPYGALSAYEAVGYEGAYMKLAENVIKKDLQDMRHRPRFLRGVFPLAFLKIVKEKGLPFPVKKGDTETDELINLRDAIQEKILDGSMAQSLFADLFLLRERWMREQMKEQQQELQTMFDLVKEPLAERLVEDSGGDESQKLLLIERLAAIRAIEVLDPAEAIKKKKLGDYSSMTRTITVISEGQTRRQLAATLVHEMVHAASSQMYGRDLHSALAARHAQEQEEDDDMDLDIEDASYDTFFASSRVGLGFSGDMQSSFVFLNEGITESLATRFLAGEDEDPYAVTAYKEESAFFMNMHAPGEMPVSKRNQSRLERSLEEARAANVLLDEIDFERLACRAFLFDTFDNAGGRAEHFRIWSQKMRSYYGDGILPALEKTWQTALGDKQDTRAARAACEELLVTRFMDTWAPLKSKPKKKRVSDAW